MRQLFSIVETMMVGRHRKVYVHFKGKDRNLTSGAVRQHLFFFSSRRRHTRCSRDWSSDVCSSDLKQGGGEVVGTVRVPLQNPDFAPYLQRVKDARPDALMVFIPAGRTATAVMKTFGDRKSVV